MTAPVAERKALIALSGLPRMGPSRLRALVDGSSAVDALASLRRGRLRPSEVLEEACGWETAGGLLARWREAAQAADVDALWDAHVERGVVVLTQEDPRWPFADDPDPPALLFCLGDLELLEHEPRAAIVGTRRCTAYGAEVAAAFGTALAEAGVPVVSGLAAGIDGAAHVGVLERHRVPSDGGRLGAPIGVAATGLDVVYPRHHRQLWRRVAEVGLLVAEVPLGSPPTRWRFPARNRLIAGLTAAVVVVESAASGGSLHTVDEATRRDVPVFAVPGPITSPVSAGTNRLLADGAHPACAADDVLLALGVAGTGPSPAPGAAPEPEAPAGGAAQVLDAVEWPATTIDQLVLRTGLPLREVALHVQSLERDGFVRQDGGWVERCR